MTTSWARVERTALCDLFAETAPDAPTLCEGWRAHDLLAHLVVRENNPIALPGIVVPQLESLTERAMATARAKRSYAELVDVLRRGAPRWSPVSLTAVDTASNTLEYLIHHEDLRRGGAMEGRDDWTSRELPAEQVADAWRRFPMLARGLFRSSHKARQVPTEAGLAPLEVGSGEVTRTVTGPAVELIMWASGRRRAARVEVTEVPTA
jgi:uncharacterized protein (TIGR03085 family)